MRDPTFCLRDILRTIEAIELFVDHMDLNDFKSDLKTKSAVLAQLAIMGEAAKLLPQAIRSANPDVAWKRMAGMRDRLIHGYFQVDYDLVGHTITSILPDEKRVIENILKQTECDE